MILTPHEVPGGNSGDMVNAGCITDITLDCITDITFVCIPKISLLSEFDTEHTGLVLLPHSQGEEGGEAGRRGV